MYTGVDPARVWTTLNTSIYAHFSYVANVHVYTLNS